MGVTTNTTGIGGLEFWYPSSSTTSIVPEREPSQSHSKRHNASRTRGNDPECSLVADKSGRKVLPGPDFLIRRCLGCRFYINRRRWMVQLPEFAVKISGLNLFVKCFFSSKGHVKHHHDRKSQHRSQRGRIGTDFTL